MLCAERHVEVFQRKVEERNSKKSLMVIISPCFSILECRVKMKVISVKEDRDENRERIVAKTSSCVWTTLMEFSGYDVVSSLSWLFLHFPTFSSLPSFFFTSHLIQWKSEERMRNTLRRVIHVFPVIFFHLKTLSIREFWDWMKWKELWHEPK